VTTVDGRVVKPLLYEAQTNSYTNAFGAKWSVQEVDARYLASELQQGFKVDYASPDGTEWTFDVPKAKAEQDLLLNVTGKPLPKVVTSSPLVGKTAAEIEELLGKPQMVEGRTWYYDTSAGTLSVFFSGSGTVTDAIPRDFNLEVVKKQ
jgi:hypothetical protein